MKRLKWVLLLIVLCLASSVASAQESQAYPGIGCTPLNAAADAVRTTEFYLVNHTNAPLSIVCPITLSGVQPTDVMVQVMGRVRAQDALTCTAFAASLVPSSTTAQTTIVDRATQTQRNRFPTSVIPDFPLDLRLQVPTINGLLVLSLTCELPVGGRLYAYVVSLSH